MQDEPSFWVRLFLFGEALLPYWWAILTSGIGPAVIMEVASRYEPKFPFLKHVSHPKARQWIIFAILSVGLLYASFSAFDDVNARLRGAQKEANEARSQGSVQQQKQIDKLASDLAEAQQKITALSNPPRNPMMLYQDNVSVALVRDPQIDLTNRIILFPVITAQNELDMSRPFMFRDWPLRCSGQLVSSMSFGAVQQISYGHVICRIEQS